MNESDKKRRHWDLNVLLPFACRKVGDASYWTDAAWAEATRHGIALDIRERSYFQPESGEYFYFVGKGSFKSFFTTRQGKRRQLLVYEAGSVLNLACAILNSKPVLNYLAIENGILWQLPIGLIMGEKIVCPHLAQACLRIMASIMETYYAGLTYLEVDSFDKVFCRYLLLAMRNAESNEFFLGLTQEDCASMLDVHRATLARIVRELKSMGVIGCFTRTKVSILDVEKLIQMADL